MGTPSLSKKNYVHNFNKNPFDFFFIKKSEEHFLGQTTNINNLPTKLSIVFSNYVQTRVYITYYVCALSYYTNYFHYL